MSATAPTVALTPHFRPQPGTILIGASCLDRDDARSLGLQVVAPYPTHDDVAQASAYCWQAASALCERLGERLNAIFGETRNRIYWQCLLMPWATAWTENLYDRYLRLDWVRKNAPNAILEIPALAVPPVFYTKCFEVWGRSHLHSTNVWLFRLLIGPMGFGERVRDVEAPPEDVEGKGMTLFGLASSVKRFARFVLHRSAQHEGEAEWNDYADEDVRDARFATEALDRSALRLEPAGDEFERLLAASVRCALPRSMFEEYRARGRFARSFIDERSLRFLCASTVFWMNDEMKYVVAELKAAGGRIVGRQHGGGYGWFDVTGPERLERYVADTFISWGWSDARGCPTLPLPDPRLANVRDSHRAASKDILFVGTQGPMYVFRYQAYWIPEFVHSRYVPMQKTFFSALEPSVGRRIVYRPYPKDYGWREEARAREILPGIRIDRSRGALKTLQQCTLVVLDHPGTTLLEALAINTPVVAYWDLAQIRMREEAQPHFDRLMEAGILHSSPEAAAAKVNAVAGDPDGWWATPSMQAVRKDFCRRFAWADRDWKTLWHDALQRETGAAA